MVDGLKQSKISQVKMCKAGRHEMTPDNTSARQGKKRCRACISERSAAKWKAMADHLPPTTQPFLAGYKEPLRKVDGGYGYMGTLAFDAETQRYTQCHLCGNFYIRLGRHIVHAHSMSARDYKIELGLPLKMSLVAPNSTVDRKYIWESYTDEERERILANLKKGHGKKHGGQRLSLYHRNLKGRCPDQLLDKIKRLMDKLGHVPTRREFSAEYGDGDLSAVYFVHGKWSWAVKLVLDAPEMYNEINLIAILQDFRVRYGREPITTDILDGLLPTNNVFRQTFGSFSKAKEAAGI